MPSGTRFRYHTIPESREQMIEESRAQMIVEFPPVTAGGRITYGQSSDALNTFMTSLGQQYELEAHPFQVRISRNGNEEVIRISTLWDLGELLQIDPPGIRLGLDGFAHPEIPLQASDARRLIQAFTARYQNDHSPLQPRFYSSQRGRIFLRFNFQQEDPEEAWPVLTTNLMTFILNALETEFQHRGAWFEVLGALVFYPPNARAFWVGDFYLGHRADWATDGSLGPTTKNQSTDVLTL